MNVTDQVCSVEQAKKLKELGVSQESFFTWYGGFDGSDVPPHVDLTDQSVNDVPINGYYDHPDRTYAAFTVAELGVMLQAHSDIGSSFFNQFKNEWAHTCAVGGSSLPIMEWFATEAQARAGMLIFLLQKKLLKPEDVNKRLANEESPVEDKVMDSK